MSVDRVLLCSDYLPPNDGGVEQVVEILARRLNAAGIETGVFTLAGDETPALADHDSISLFRANTIDLTGTIGLQSTVSPQALFGFGNVLETFDPDLVHVHNRFFFTSYACGVVHASRADVPIVTSLHLGDIGEIDGVGGMVAELFEQTAGRLLLRASDHVVTVSEAVATQARKLNQNVPVSVVRNAVELAEFPHSPPDGKEVVFVGRLVRNNGPRDLVAAVPHVLEEHPDAHFHIVGTGPLEDELTKEADDLGVSESVSFHGFVDDITDAYDTADVFCRPSYSEGLPLTVLESMASGVPPVVSEIAGVPEVVSHEETGMLVTPGDIDELVRSLIWTLDDTERLTQLGEQAREYAEANLSWDQRVHKVLSVYQQTVDS